MGPFSGGEIIVLLAVAALVLGPERLPHYAQQLARLVRELRRMAQGASAQVRTELGPEFDDIDWRKLDPRQYDPRRIVREALADTFDPDDPLGLRDLDKPVSAGGPADAGSDHGDSRDRGARDGENGAAGSAGSHHVARESAAGDSAAGDSPRRSRGRPGSGDAPAPRDGSPADVQPPFDLDAT